jgi:hypothetical protein
LSAVVPTNFGNFFLNEVRIISISEGQDTDLESALVSFSPKGVKVDLDMQQLWNYSHITDSKRL